MYLTFGSIAMPTLTTNYSLNKPLVADAIEDVAHGVAGLAAAGDRFHALLPPCEVS